MSRPFKHFDRILNIILVVVALLWAYDHFVRQKEPESLTNEALAAFQGTPQQSEVKPHITAEPIVYTAGKILPIDFNQATNIIKQSDIPVALFIYTSWCPYCNKIYPVIEQITREQEGRLLVLAVSVDQNKSKFEKYISDKSAPPPFNTYYMGAGEDYDRLTNYLQLIGFRFNGGIPFIAFFSQNKPAGQIGGFVEKSSIESIIQDIYSKAEQQPSKPSL